MRRREKEWRTSQHSANVERHILHHVVVRGAEPFILCELGGWEAGGQFGRE